MRRAFSQTLVQSAQADPRMVFITGDLGFQVFDEFRNSFPARFINAGVAEAQMIYAAAGLAKEGFRPIAYSIASFATGRPFEQIRYCLAYPNLPVVLVGAGRGYLYSTSGVSHHAPDDLGLMSILPGMTVVAPGDPVEVSALLPQLLKIDGPSYFTVGKYGEAAYEAEEPPIVGKGRLLKLGSKVAVLSTGELGNELVRALNLLAAENIAPTAYQFHTIKPLDMVTLQKISESHQAILICEEHLPIGGLYSHVANWAVENGIKTQIKRAGAPDRFLLGNLKQIDVRRNLGIDAEGIAQRVRQLWNRGVA